MDILIVVADIYVRRAHVENALLQLVRQVVHIAQEIDSIDTVNHANLLSCLHALLRNLGTDVTLDQ